MGRTQSLNRPLFLRTNLLWVITWWPGYFIKPWNDIFENCACISDHSLFQWFSNFMEEIYSVPVLVSSCACRSWHVWTMAASRILGPLLQRSVADYFDVSSQEHSVIVNFPSFWWSVFSTVGCESRESNEYKPFVKSVFRNGGICHSEPLFPIIPGAQIIACKIIAPC